MPISILNECVSSVHVLSSAAWFGALVYRAFFVEPKASRFFRGSAEYERFSLDLAHGMRYVVMSALIVCGLSGFTLLGLHWNRSEGWLSLMAGKAGLWLVACVLFAYISWVFWPRRVFASEEEWPRVRRQGFILACAMIGIAGVGFVLGQFAQAIRIG